MKKNIIILLFGSILASCSIDEEQNNYSDIDQLLINLDKITVEILKNENSTIAIHDYQKKVVELNSLNELEKLWTSNFNIENSLIRSTIDLIHQNEKLLKSSVENEDGLYERYMQLDIEGLVKANSYVSDRLLINTRSIEGDPCSLWKTTKIVLGGVGTLLACGSCIASGGLVCWGCAIAGVLTIDALAEFLENCT